LPDEADAPPPGAKIQIQLWQPQHKELLVESPAPARVALRLLNYPAWQVSVNGKSVVPERPDDVDQMIVPIGAGKSEIRVRFSRTLDRTAGAALSLLSILVGFGLLRSRRTL
jgi:hypothetical protein